MTENKTKIHSFMCQIAHPVHDWERRRKYIALVAAYFPATDHIRWSAIKKTSQSFSMGVIVHPHQLSGCDAPTIISHLEAVRHNGGIALSYLDGTSSDSYRNPKIPAASLLDGVYVDKINFDDEQGCSAVSTLTKILPRSDMIIAFHKAVADSCWPALHSSFVDVA